MANKDLKKLFNEDNLGFLCLRWLIKLAQVGYLINWNSDHDDIIGE